MPAPTLSREQVLDRLLATFRARGYDGASLSELSAVTGLGRSSLYHHFPGGKEEMAEAVLAHLERLLEQTLFAAASAPGTPAERLEATLAVVDQFYDQGRSACLLERLCASVDRARFGAGLREAFRAWIEALTSIAVDAGLPADEARDRAEDAVSRVEGALVVAAGTEEPAVFSRALARIRRSFLAR